MDAPEGRPAAPDLFTALRLVPVDPSLRTSREDAGSSRAAPPRRSTPPRIAPAAPSPKPAEPPADPVAAPPPSSAESAKYRGLADLLEPDPIEPLPTIESAAPLVELPPPPPVPVPAAAAPVGALVHADLVAPAEPEPEAEVEPRGKGLPWGWAALSLMLAGALGWVLYTQTDLLRGDVIAHRDAKALAAAQAEVDAAEAARKTVEYGALQLDSKPDGARVWSIQPGPEASFPNLPARHEYMVSVSAPGHLPRVRLVKGSELSSPVAIDLDPAPDPRATPPLPEERPPKLADGNPGEPGTLVLRSSTPGAELGLLVGYTPGVKVVDLDVSATHHFRLTKAGFEPHDLVVKGRHWEEVGGNLVYTEHVELRPLDPAAEDTVAIDDEPAPAAIGGVPPPPAEPAVSAGKAAKKKPKKKKKKGK